MEESAPKVVPPTPPVASVPPPLVGTPLIDRAGDHDRHHLPRCACEAAGHEGHRLIGEFFAYHGRKDLVVRRLVLATPVRAAGVKRKARGPTGDGARPRSDAVATCGATFGCTLGIMVAYLEGRGVPAERAHVLRTVRAQLLPAAESLRSIRGADAEHLALGMASCRVVHAERAALPELAAARCPRIDHKYGHACTAVGATAALLAAFGCMAEVPNHCRHFVHDHSLGKALRCAEAALETWRPAVMHLPDEHWAALAAERRAMQRASLAVRQAIEVALARDLEPLRAMALQLAWARAAAYPSGETVDEFTQSRLCERIRDRRLFGPLLDAAVGAAPSPLDPVVPGVLPLSEIPEAALMTPRDAGRQPREADAGSDAPSCASSSWRTLSSQNSAFSHASQDSLSGLVEALGGSGALV